MNPFSPLARVIRNGIPESLHQGVIVVADADGNIRYSAGDPNTVFFPRSSLKLIQALQFHQSGAYQNLRLTSTHLALACASHDGETIHTDTVKDWLKKIDLTPSDLACGNPYPKHLRTRVHYYETGKKPDRADHECSGKHCGMLSTCKFLGYDKRDYHRRTNPVQKLLQSRLETLGNLASNEIFWGVDGCELPAPAFPVKTMATMNAKFGGSRHNKKETQLAMDEILDAIARHPEYVSGSENRDRKIIAVLKNKVILKAGAEGSYAVILPVLKLGAVIKMADGHPRALSAVLIRLLKQLSAITDSEYDELRDLAEPVIYNSVQEPVGTLAPCF